MPSPPANSLVTRYFLLLFGLAILMMGRLLWPFASTIVMSLLLITIFQPLYNRLRRHTARHLASLITCLLIVVLIFVPLIFLVISLSKEAVVYALYVRDINLADRVRELLTSHSWLVAAQTRLAGMGLVLRPDDISSSLSGIASNAAMFLYAKASAWAGNILAFVIDFALMILVIFFLLADYDRLLDFLLKLSPLPDAQNQQLVRRFQEISQAVLLGNGICGLIQGGLGGLLFVYFDFRSPVLWGMLMGLASFVPIVGIGSILLPTALIVWANGHPHQAVTILIFFCLVFGLVEYLLKPHLVGRKVKMHTLLVFLGILGGIRLFGVLGIAYGPLIITAFLTMADIYLNNYAIKQE